MCMCAFHPPQLTFSLVQAVWCFSDSKVREMLRWRWRLAAETMAAQLQNSLCNFVFIGYFQYIYWLWNWTMLTVPSQVSYSAASTNYAAIVKSTPRWALESEIQMGRPWVGRRFNAIFSKPLWFGNLTRNLLGSRFLMRFLELLGQAWVWNTWSDPTTGISGLLILAWLGSAELHEK